MIAAVTWIDVVGAALVAGLVVAAILVPKFRAALGGAALFVLGAIGGKAIADRFRKTPDATDATEKRSSRFDDVTPITNPAASSERRIRERRNEISAVPDSDLDRLAAEYDRRTTDE